MKRLLRTSIIWWAVWTTTSIMLTLSFSENHTGFEVPISQARLVAIAEELALTHGEPPVISAWPQTIVTGLMASQYYGIYYRDRNVVFITPWGWNLNTGLHELSHWISERGSHTLHFCITLRNLLRKYYRSDVATADVYRTPCRNHVIRHYQELE